MEEIKMIQCILASYNIHMKKDKNDKNYFIYDDNGQYKYSYNKTGIETWTLGNNKITYCKEKNSFELILNEDVKNEFDHVYHYTSVFSGNSPFGMTIYQNGEKNYEFYTCISDCEFSNDINKDENEFGYQEYYDSDCLTLDISMKDVLFCSACKLHLNHGVGKAFIEKEGNVNPIMFQDNNPVAYFEELRKDIVFSIYEPLKLKAYDAFESILKYFYIPELQNGLYDDDYIDLVSDIALKKLEKIKKAINDLDGLQSFEIEDAKNILFNAYSNIYNILTKIYMKDGYSSENFEKLDKIKIR